MLLRKKAILPILSGATCYYSNIDIMPYSHTILTFEQGRFEKDYECVARPWGLENKAPLLSTSIKDKLSKKDVDFIATLLMERINLIALWGGGSFGPYKILPIEKPGDLVTIKKKPKAKTRKQAIDRMKELVFLVYGTTQQDEIRKGMYVKTYETERKRWYLPNTYSTVKGKYTVVHYYGNKLHGMSAGLSLFRWGTTLTMRLGKTLAVILGCLLNPFSDYWDINDSLYQGFNVRNPRTTPEYREEYRKKLLEDPPEGRFYTNRKNWSRTDENGQRWVTRHFYRTNLKTGVPDKIKINPSYWFDCFDGPELPEFHFRIEYANNFSIQYSPKEKNKWNIHMPS